jgi:Family of unknown function (DUF6476)
MDEQSPDGLPPGLRFLKGLVIALTLTMIAGVIAIVALLVTKMNGPVPVPETLALPDGATAQAVTMGVDWVGVVTTDNRILIFDRLTGALRQELVIK